VGLKIENEQTRDVRFQSVMTLTDEGSYRSKNALACPNLTGLYRVKTGHIIAQKLTGDNQESKELAPQIRNMTVACKLELEDCPKFEVLSSKTTVVWADNREPSAR